MTRIIVLITAALLPLVLAPPVAAADTPWRPARCATGAFTDVTVDYSAGYPTVRAQGWIQPCADAGETNGFVTVTYTARTGHIGHLRSYVSPDAPTGFSVTIPLDDHSLGIWNMDGGLRAVCVAYRERGQVACLRLTPDATGDEPLVSPMSPTDKTLLVLPLRYPPDGNPSCGTCA